MDISTIQSLSHKQLRDECRKVNLATTGTSNTLRLRLRGKFNSFSACKVSHNSKKAATAEEPPSKRFKSITDNLICPITRELPFDPVTAKDGRIYERGAIEKHIEESAKAGRPLKSPITNEIMESAELLPSFQHKSQIVYLIDAGLVTGDLLTSFKAKERVAKAAKDLLEKATNGDTFAMFDVFNNYRRGRFGFKEDHKEAYRWLEKASKGGNTRATAHLGHALIEGKLGHRAVQKNLVQGMVLISLAAAEGSVFASYKLGMAFAYGHHGLPVDTTKATHWLCKSLEQTGPVFLDTALRGRAREVISGLEFADISDEEEDEVITVYVPDRA